MKRYIAFLRGINIGGKNKIAMAALKNSFESLDFEEVRTYLNSGNVIFSTEENDTDELARRIEAMIKADFALDIPVFVISREGLADILCHAPEWWGDDDKEIYDNLIFMMPPVTFAELYQRIGAPKEGLERIEHYKDAVFWSFRRKSYQKTTWWPATAKADIGARLTIRTAGTVRKIAGM